MITRLIKIIPVVITIGTAAYEVTRPTYITTSKKTPKSLKSELELIEFAGGKTKWVKEKKISEMLEEGWEFFERKKYVVKRERFRDPDGAVLMFRKQNEK